jgi:hypothetical protein
VRWGFIGLFLLDSSGRDAAAVAGVLAAELYAHHSAGLDDDDSAELHDQVADRRLQPGQGLPPLASEGPAGDPLTPLAYGKRG